MLSLEIGYLFSMLTFPDPSLPVETVGTVANIPSQLLRFGIGLRASRVLLHIPIPAPIPRLQAPYHNGEEKNSGQSLGKSCKERKGSSKVRSLAEEKIKVQKPGRFRLGGRRSREYPRQGTFYSSSKRTKSI